MAHGDKTNDEAATPKPVDPEVEQEINDTVEVSDDVQVDSVFDDDEEVLDDNLGYDD